MSEHLANRQRRRELLITLSYTIFSVLMVVVSSIEGWPVFYTPLIFAELAFVWWSYIKGFRSYMFRAFIVTLCISLNVFLYGIQGENFFNLIPTLCVEFVLLSLYEFTRVMDIAIIKTICLFLYHLLIKGYDFPTDHLGRNRILLQSLSLIVLMALCLYRIHHHHQEEEDVVNLEEQVQREQKIRNDFVANTSHELRTPVNTISGMCEIMLQKNLPDDIHSSVLDIQMTGVELQDIVNDIMDYSALEADTLVLHPRVYNITSTLNDVMNMTVFENKEKHLDIIFDCDPNIPCQLEGDEQQLRRVLNSLISNAIKFTTEGGVIVRVTYRPEAYGINLVISVKDTGVGLNIEDQELILRGFYQTDSDRNRKSSGMGLGLPITSALIKKMGGFLTIQSEEGVGSEFSFAIPQKVVNEAPCISLSRSGMVKLVWFYNSRSSSAPLRNAFVEHIQHFSEAFGIASHRATSLEECQRRLSHGQASHLILGQEEYIQNKAYFDEVSEKIHVILITDRNEIPNAGSRIHVLYKPYNAIMLAEIFNDKGLMSASVNKKELRKFIAPTAKILVVDDNLMNLKVVEGLLRKYRIKVVAATSGEEALSMITSQDYDFVFMDHMMPGMDGVECFHHIREKQGSYYAQVPIIALTANAIAGSREMFLEEGFSEFVAKPIDTALLNDILFKFIPLEKQITEDDIKYLTNEDDSSTATVDHIPSKDSVKEDIKPVAEPVETADDSMMDDPFATLTEVDKDTALTYCGTAEDFVELAEVYYSSGKKYIEDLQTAYEEGDLKNYALLSHTVKGTSKTLGLPTLSEMALAQEMSAKEENAEKVNEAHEAFIAEYGKVLDMFRQYFGEEADDTGSQVAETDAPSEITYKEIDDWDNLKARLLDCLEAYESKAFEDIVEENKDKALNGVPLGDALAKVMELSSSFDYEGAIECLSEIGGAS